MSRIAQLSLLWLVGAAYVNADPLVIQPLGAVVQNIASSGAYQTSVSYGFDGSTWVNNASPLAFISGSTLQADALTDPFLLALTSFGGGWTFGFSGTTLADSSLLVQTYDVQAPGPPATNQDALAKAAAGDPFIGEYCLPDNCIGSELQVAYDPSGDDPTSDIHWVQVIYTNAFTGDPGYFIDNSNSQEFYYDTNGAATPTSFLDVPAIPDPGDPYFFDAELFLVSGPNANSPGPVTIYGAIDWGWQNSLDPPSTPEPATYALSGAALALIAFARRRRSSRSV